MNRQLGYYVLMLK